MCETVELPNPALKTQTQALNEISAKLEAVSAEERVRWALERFRSEIMLSSSFGAQSAVTFS